jgi:hypothetical protein
MHYDALDHPWSEEEFDRQWQALCALFAPDRPVSNKNHYLRWENDTEFYDWCARRGIELDQSKGASKTGEAGFNFGTCHTFFPVDFAGERLDVLSLATPTQDLTVFAPEELAAHLLDAAVRHHGICHFLFHPAHAATAGVPNAIRNAVAAARERGLEWWTAREINSWERGRRQVEWRGHTAVAESGRAVLRAAADLPGATLLWLDVGTDDMTCGGAPLVTEPMTCFGFRFRSVTLDIAAGADYAFEWGVSPRVDS